MYLPEAIAGGDLQYHFWRSEHGFFSFCSKKCSIATADTGYYSSRLHEPNCLIPMSVDATGRVLSLVLLAIPLFVLAACSSGDDGHHRGMMAQLDTTRLQKIYGSMEEDYGQLMNRYEEMRAQMPPDMQQMVQHMQQMHGEATAMHQGMMHGKGMMHKGGMMGRGMGMMRMMGAREWDQQMLGMHEGMAHMHERAGREEMAQMHRQIVEWYRKALENTPSGGAAEEAPEPPEEVLDGANLYAQQCATCHGSQGGGGGSAFPPLAGANWVTGDEETPIRIVLHGLQGRMQVRGTTYRGVMPAFGSRLSNAEIAAILTYVRTSWGNEASEVTADEVQEVRREYNGRTRPWSGAELQ